MGAHRDKITFVMSEICVYTNLHCLFVIQIHRVVLELGEFFQKLLYGTKTKYYTVTVRFGVDVQKVNFRTAFFRYGDYLFESRTHTLKKIGDKDNIPEREGNSILLDHNYRLIGFSYYLFSVAAEQFPHKAFGSTTSRDDKIVVKMPRMS